MRAPQRDLHAMDHALVAASLLGELDGRMLKRVHIPPKAIQPALEVCVMMLTQSIVALADDQLHDALFAMHAAPPRFR